MKTPTITIKLLHERKAGGDRRKLDGYSGTIYRFLWSVEHGAYVYTTDKQEEIDDLFRSQGRSMGAYFAPVFHDTPEPTISAEMLGKLAERAIRLPNLGDVEDIAAALLEAYHQGKKAGEVEAAGIIAAHSAANQDVPSVTTSSTIPAPQKPKGKAPPPLPPITAKTAA